MRSEPQLQHLPWRLEFGERRGAYSHIPSSFAFPPRCSSELSDPFVKTCEGPGPFPAEKEKGPHAGALRLRCNCFEVSALVSAGPFGLLRDGGRDGRRPRAHHSHHVHERQDFSGIAGERDGRLLQLAIHELRITTAVKEMDFRE